MAPRRSARLCCSGAAEQEGFEMAEQSFDVVVIGSCLNVGCIPSKALLQSSHLYAMAGHELAQHGVKAGKVELDFATLMGRKDKVVADFTKGIEFLFRKNKVTWLKGLGRLVGNGNVEVLNGGKGEVVAARHIIIATGSDVMPLKGVEIDEKQVVTSTGALAL